MACTHRWRTSAPKASGNRPFVLGKSAQPSLALRGEALYLADQPRLHPGAVLDRQLVASWTIGQLEPQLRPEISVPVRLKLHGERRDYRARERPVQVLRVKPVNKVAQPHWRSPGGPCQQVSYSQGSERIARFSNGWRSGVGVGQSRHLAEL
jgi:hypothetical protein